MAREPKLCKKGPYWFTKAGNPSGQYFGRIDQVPYNEVRKLFAEYVQGLEAARVQSRMAGFTTLELCDLFLDWVLHHRSDRTYAERRLHLERFCNFQVGGRKLATLPACRIEASDLLAFTASLKADGPGWKKVDPFTTEKHATSVKAAFNWGTKHPSPVPHLQGGFRPFSSVEKYRRPLAPLLENELLTREEIEALFNFADADLASIHVPGSYRRRRPEEYRKGDDNPYGGFEELLRCYWHTGARTSELAACEVKDFIRVSRQLVLGRHKRSATMKDPVARRITLNEAATVIVEKWCQGKVGTESIFTDPKGRTWTRTTLAARFAAVRERAGVRSEVTIYSFRHLWISEILMAGVDIATLARMAGTSIAMIERVYGHFTSDHLRQAQERLDVIRRNEKLSA